MCNRPAIEMTTINAAMDNTALAMCEIDVSHATLGAVDATKRVLLKASRAGQIPRPLATVILRGLEVIEGGTQKQLLYDGQDYDLSLLLTSGVVTITGSRKPLAGGSRSAACGR